MEPKKVFNRKSCNRQVTLVATVLALLFFPECATPAQPDPVSPSIQDDSVFTCRKYLALPSETRNYYVMGLWNGYSVAEGILFRMAELSKNKSAAEGTRNDGVLLFKLGEPMAKLTVGASTAMLDAECVKHPDGEAVLAFNDVLAGLSGANALKRARGK